MRQLFNRFGAFLWIMTPPWIKKGGVSLFAVYLKPFDPTLGSGDKDARLNGPFCDDKR